MKKFVMVAWSVVVFGLLLLIEVQLVSDSTIPLAAPIITMVMFIAVVSYQLFSPHSNSSKRLILVVYIIPIVLFSVVYWQKNTYAGGDIDPIAFLQKKTSARGGYLLLTDKTTYRQHTLTKEPFFAHPFSEFKLLKGIPAIATLKDYSINADVPTHGRTMRVAMSLKDAIVHVPFDEAKLQKLFAEQIRTEGYITNVEHMVASELKRLANPTFRSMKKYPPAEGYFEITLDDPEKALGDLTQYGFEIVSLPGDKPRLGFQITYGEGQANYLLLDTKQTSLQPPD